MDAEKQMRYQKFLTSGQEPMRLAIALEDFFQGGVDSAARGAYGQYLSRRRQPAAAALIEAEDTERLGELGRLGWLDRGLTDGLIDLARDRQKTAALVWLLRWKGERYGFQDRDFSL